MDETMIEVLYLPRQRFPGVRALRQSSGVHSHAPGLIGASSAITNYLEAGGRLLLTGQDVGYWDGGGTQDFFASYFRDYLRAVYVNVLGPPTEEPQPESSD
jgi:hypothetical protein